MDDTHKDSELTMSQWASGVGQQIWMGHVTHDPLTDD